jgi:hypothetical protein
MDRLAGSCVQEQVRFVAFLVVLLTSALAWGHPPPELAYDPPKDWHDDRAFFEWSTWLRLGYGVARETSYQAARTTAVEPPSVVKVEDQRQMVDAAIGADVTFPIPTSRVRLGPWLELRPHGTFVGGELSIAGKSLDMFMYDGEAVYNLRGGASASDWTAALAYGYRCPWKLWGPYNKATRYMIGARLVGSFTQSRSDPGDWNATIGLEFEPVGALRYVAAIKSWY